MRKRMKRKALPIEDREISVTKAIGTPALEDGGKLHPQQGYGSGLLDDYKERQPGPEGSEERPPEEPDEPKRKRMKATEQADPISKIADVESYDPSKVTDEVLRDDFRIVLAWYSTWKKDPEAFKHDLPTLTKLLRKILLEAVRRGPEVIRFDPNGMTPNAKEFFSSVARELRIPRPMYKRVALEPTSDPGDFTTNELEQAHKILHFFYRAEATSQEALPGWSIEDVVNLHALVVTEMERRGIRHPPPPDDGLDDVSGDFERHFDQSTNKRIEKSRYMQVQHSGVEEGREISIEEVLPHFQSFKLRKPYVYLVGGLANNGKTTGDIDILVKDSEALPKAFKHALHFRLGRGLPQELSDRLSLHFDNFHGPFTNHVPLYDLLLERTEGEVIEMRDSSDPEDLEEREKIIKQASSELWGDEGEEA